MNWKNSLDKFLTSPPNDHFDSWCEDICENKFDSDFFEANEDWILDSNYKSQCNIWLNSLYNRDKTSEEAAKIIQKAHSLYIKNK